jgi:hypothetical protein
MNREWIGRAAARSYPADARAERGAEMVGTLLDAGDESWTAFVRQVGSMVRAGLAARAGEALRQPPQQIAIYALAWAAVMVLVLALVGILGFEPWSGHVGFPEGAFLSWMLPTLVVVSFTLKQTRLSGILGLAVIVSRVLEGAGMPPTALAELVLSLAGFALLALAPRRIPSSGRWAWVIPTAVLAYFEVTHIGLRSGADILIPLFLALCFVPFKPAFAIGTALAWSMHGAITLIAAPGRETAVSILLVACVPLAVIAASVGRLGARRI